MIARLLVVALVGFVAFTHAYKNFDGYTVLSVVPQSDWQLRFLEDLEDLGFEVDFWIRPSGVDREAHVLVKDEDNLEQLLLSNGLKVNTFIGNLQQQIDDEQAEMAMRRVFAAGDNPRDLAVNQYHTMDEINAWLTAMAASHSDIARLTPIGRSFENRTLNVIRIGKPSDTGRKSAFWIDGNIHAREWVTSATAIWIINELLTKYATNADYKRLVDGLDFYIMPVMNVDGFVYSHEHSRNWRKTRTGPRHGCYGADPNRNWDNHFAGAGTSGFSCSDIYHGPNAFSEPCVKAAADFLRANGQNGHIKAVMSMHSYSQLWFYPYGYRSNTYPSDVDELRTVSNNAVAAMRAVHNERYRTGTPADILYSAAGNSMDWQKDQAGIKYAFGMELRPRRGSHYGFVLPARFIVPTAEETWAGLQVVANRLLA